MVSERLEVRLDEEHRRKLSELAVAQDSPISEVVRKLIDSSYEEIMRERRRAAVREIAEMEIEDVPEPEELSRQLAETHDTYPYLHRH